MSVSFFDLFVCITRLNLGFLINHLTKCSSQTAAGFQGPSKKGNPLARVLRHTHKWGGASVGPSSLASHFPFYCFLVYYQYAILGPVFPRGFR
jgi:hypothetical protein